MPTGSHPGARKVLRNNFSHPKPLVRCGKGKSINIITNGTLIVTGVFGSSCLYVTLFHLRFSLLVVTHALLAPNSISTFLLVAPSMTASSCHTVLQVTNYNCLLISYKFQSFLVSHPTMSEMKTTSKVMSVCCNNFFSSESSTIMFEESHDTNAASVETGKILTTNSKGSKQLPPHWICCGVLLISKVIRQMGYSLHKCHWDGCSGGWCCSCWHIAGMKDTH